ncbi:MAG: sulfotransferase domain-containing protein [Bacteroidales bacterium]|nr:sulfotransferase domain-containing protein [Bacteroidales bacterium]
MTQTIIHIGYPKTATSWFTDFFYPYVHNANVSYSDNIFYDMDANPPFFNIVHNSPLPPKELHIIIAHKFVGIENFKWDHGVYRHFFLKQLKQKYPNAKIIVFIRNQIDFLASVYSSYLTHGGNYTFKKLFKQGKLGDGTMFAFEYIDYYKLIKLYKETFGENNVYVYVFEEFMKNNRTFLDTFKSTFNLDINLQQLNYEKYNETLRIGLARLIKISNYFIRKGVQPKKNYFNLPFLFKWMTKKNIIAINRYRFWGRKMNKEEILGTELIEYMKNYYKESNRKLIDELGIKNIADYNYPL